MKKPLLGKFKAPKTAAHMLGPVQKIDFPMHRYSPDEEVDFCIVGVGAAGGVLVQRLARASFSVVGIEAGPFWDTERARHRRAGGGLPSGEKADERRIQTFGEAQGRS